MQEPVRQRPLDVIEIDTAGLKDTELQALSRYFSMLARRDVSLSDTARLFHADVAAQLSSVLDWRVGRIEQLEIEMADPDDPDEMTRGWQLPKRRPTGTGWA